MKCSNCGNTGEIRSGIKNGKAYSDLCEKCAASFTTSALYARKFERDRDRSDHSKDIIQRYEGTEINPEFVEAYREQAVAQWGEDVVRDYGRKSRFL